MSSRLSLRLPDDMLPLVSRAALTAGELHPPSETFFRMLFGTETRVLLVAVAELVADVPAKNQHLCTDGHIPSKSGLAVTPPGQKNESLKTSGAGISQCR